jgi:hypothetical protein
MPDSTLSLLPDFKSSERSSADAATRPLADNHQSRTRK